MIESTTLRWWMAKAYESATFSPDPSSQNGAVMLSRSADGELTELSQGYNHFYKGIPENTEDRTEKLRRIEHAERDALFTAAKTGAHLGGSIMICPWSACEDCARAIIGCGVSMLVVHKERQDLTPDRWRSKVDEALSWVANSGIVVVSLEGGIHAPPILVSGELWTPRDCRMLTDEEVLEHKQRLAGRLFDVTRYN